MKRFYLLAALALAGCSLFHTEPAHSATLVASWDNPVINTDGSTIADTGVESLASVRIEFGTCAADGVSFGVKAGEFSRTRVAGQPLPSTATNNVPPGKTCIRVLVRNVAGNESPPSNVANHVYPAATPSAPKNVIATEPSP